MVPSAPEANGDIVLQTGDVLLMLGHGEISKLIAWCSDSLYSHAAIVADRDELIEAAPAGVRRRSLSQRCRDTGNYFFIDAFRPLTAQGEALTDADRASVLRKADSLLGKAYPLDILATIGIVTAMRGKIPQDTYARLVIYVALDYVVKNDDKRQMCSEVVYRSLAECDVTPRGRLAPVIVTSEATHWPFPDIDWPEFFVEVMHALIPFPHFRDRFAPYAGSADTPESRVPQYTDRQLHDAIGKARDRFGIEPPPDGNGVPVPHPNPKLITPLQLTDTPSHLPLGRVLSGSG